MRIYILLGRPARLGRHALLVDAPWSGHAQPVRRTRCKHA